MNIKKSALSIAVASSLLLSACGGSSDSDTPEVVANTAPTAISLSNLTVAENSAAAVVGDLSATDADSGDTFTFSISDDRFAISGSSLSLADGVEFDYESEATVDLEVTVTDSSSNTYSETLTISVEDVLDTYTFDSKIIDGESSVNYTGQVARHVLIAELNHYIGNVLQSELDDSTLTTRQNVIDKLNSFYRSTETQYESLEITFMDNTEQTFLTDIASSRTLSGKIAGNDAAGQHKDWSTEFAGWGAKGSTTPEGLIDIFFGQLADNAEQSILGNARFATTGEEITSVYVNTDGTDLKQLIQKFLLMAIAYSQGTDDYLDEDYDGKGLTTENIGSVEDAYTTLEHQFDEGFGYFGASSEYLAYSDNELSGSAGEDDRADWNGNHDTNGDGLFDLTSEVNFGNSVNAAKRDRGTASNTNPTDFTQVTMEAFLAGRQIINDNVGFALTDAQMTELLAQRDIAVDGWERSIAATVVHYINDTIADLDDLVANEGNFSYTDLAKHFSELKGFALGLQFNRLSKVSDADFEEFHTLVGDAPELDTANIAAYQADLLLARDIIENSLSFDAENVANW